MPISARNQFPGKVLSIKLGAVMAEVIIDLYNGRILAAKWIHHGDTEVTEKAIQSAPPQMGHE